MVRVKASQLVTPSEIISNGIIEFDETTGLITGIHSSGDADVVFDGVLIPGFVDIHCHGGGGFSFDDPSNVKNAADFHLKHGTTAVLASLVSAPVAKQIELLKALKPFANDGTIAGAHFEGPFLSGAKCGAQNPAVLTAPNSEDVENIISASDGVLKLITIAPELENAIGSIKRFVGAGVTVALGHSDANSDEATIGVNAGATVVTHLFNAMRSLHHRESSLADVSLTDDRLSVELITDGKHVGDLSIQLAHKAKGRKVIAITDAISAAGMPDGDYDLGGMKVTCADDVAVIAGTSTLAGSTLNMERVFSRLVSVYGFDLVEAAWACSTAPAKAIGLNTGALEIGKKADFILWNNSINSVYKNGCLVHKN
ncbi:MAG: hypothetical protein RLZZ330_24 [Actinomycetota bacterium]|jgi:N-acetylglucosamine-6-phosphate deacetylase